MPEPDILKAIDDEYHKILFGQGDEAPELILTSFGAFFKDGTVMEFDDNGNYYRLSEKEQQRRKNKFKEFVLGKK
ncbi:MAG: hypothetical protein KGI50_07770 [Patescibacteria group bacterium]|nr:hypothetical protein [Patescibacteria group bacterium]MDE2439348.1 hypothetical protein [Patescibacteria group bacterium]